MHPSGFDTRAVASEEATVLLAIADGTLTSSVDGKIRDILEANSFVQKVSFIRNVLKTWIKHGRLGGRPTPQAQSQTRSGGKQLDENPVSPPRELYWEGAQEYPEAGGPGSKFVWVTVGAPGGDGEYRAVSLKPSESHRQTLRESEKRTRDDDRETAALMEKLQGLGRKDGRV